MLRDGEVTQLLAAHRAGDQAAFERLTGLVYDDLRRIAASMLRGAADKHTLSATGVVHEAWLKLEDSTRKAWNDRAHFMAVAARAMRQVIVDHARQKGAVKRGGEMIRIELDGEIPEAADRAEWVLAVNEALERLAAHNPRLARVVECRFFGGYSNPEIAEALEIPLRSIERDWPRARAWLKEALREAGGAPDGSD